jgi:hypothetical protein
MTLAHHIHHPQAGRITIGRRHKDQLGFLLAGTEATPATASELERIYHDYQQVWLDLGQTWIQARRGSNQMR